MEKYVLALDPKTAEQIDEIPIRFKDSDGTETITTITKAANEPFIYEFLPEKQTRLYLIEGNDTLMIVTQNQDGIFDFQEPPPLEHYVFTLDEKNSDQVTEIQIRFADSYGKETITTIAKDADQPFVYEFLPEKRTKLYLLEGSDTVMIVMQNQDGLFDFQELPDMEKYVLALDPKTAEQIDEIPIRFKDNNGVETITTITKATDQPFVYEYLPEKQTKLYLMYGSDTLMVVTQNEDGLFDFQNLSNLENYVLALDPESAKHMDKIPIRFKDNDGVATITTLSKAAGEPFVYEYLPEMLTKLYLIEGTDTVMIVTQDQDGYFDFQEVPQLDNYVLALDSKDAGQIDEIPIRFKDSDGTEIISTITKSANKPFVYEYLPEKQTRLYLMQGTDTVMIVTQNDDGIFDFQKSTFEDDYVFALDKKDAAVMEEINVKFSSNDGKEMVITAEQSKSESTIYLYLSESSSSVTVSTKSDSIVTKSGQLSEFSFIAYDFNSNSLSTDGKNTISIIVTKLKGNPNLNLHLEGHTDSKGSAEYNRLLSKQRTQSVINLLLKGGISKTRISASYFGESRPRSANQNADGTDNVEGRELNRRVAVTFYDSKDAEEVEKKRKDDEAAHLSVRMETSQRAVVKRSEKAVERSIAEAAVCRSVSNGQPVDPGNEFPSSVGKLWFFTKVLGKEGELLYHITHVWYFGDKEMARIKLTVKSSSWRTYSSKNISTLWTGKWKVDVISEEGKIIESVPFQIQ